MTPGIKIVVAVFVSLIIGAIIGFVIGQSSVPNTVVTNNGGGQTNDQYQTLEQQYQTLQQQYQTSEQQLNYYKQVLSLSYSDTLISNQVVNQPAGYFSYWCYTANYTGYIVVNVQSSTTTQTYARVYWNAYGINYDNSISVGSQGTAVFPVLPSNYCVGVGNNNLINGATETITITYYY
ncbi:hypothetical protein [Sulfolobus acidocaldarius]|uniref:hypothetical protein n=1 Tax=Sulfolobus acidocaldarius TaxID=2285 RepID=UPI0007855DF5|nr:hypothetical protein [Sulfolobus acidocaldarius]